MDTSFALKGVMESVENCTIFSKKRDGTRVELDRTEIRHKVCGGLRKRSSAQKEYAKEYRLENRDLRLVQMKQYHLDNRDTLLVKKKQYYKENREKLLVQMKQYSKEYRQKNGE